LTTKEIIEYFHVCPQTVTNWVISGLKAIKRGKTNFYKVKDLEKFISKKYKIVLVFSEDPPPDSNPDLDLDTNTDTDESITLSQAAIKSGFRREDIRSLIEAKIVHGQKAGKGYRVSKKILEYSREEILQLLGDTSRNKKPVAQKKKAKAKHELVRFVEIRIVPSISKKVQDISIGEIVKSKDAQVSAIPDETADIKKEMILGKEAAALLGIHVSAVTQMVKSGELEGVIHGRGCYVVRSSVQKAKPLEPIVRNDELLLMLNSAILQAEILAAAIEEKPQSIAIIQEQPLLQGPAKVELLESAPVPFMLTAPKNLLALPLLPSYALLVAGDCAPEEIMVLPEVIFISPTSPDQVTNIFDAPNDHELICWGFGIFSYQKKKKDWLERNAILHARLAEKYIQELSKKNGIIPIKCHGDRCWLKDVSLALMGKGISDRTMLLWVKDGDNHILLSPELIDRDWWIKKEGIKSLLKTHKGIEVSFFEAGKKFERHLTPTIIESA
jgi:hypothetical protein